MKKLISLTLVILMALTMPITAEEGELGQSGGVSSGKNLPKSIEKYVTIPSSTTNKYIYKEVVFITGKPLVFEGEITVAKDTSKVEEKIVGSYKETYTIEATNLETSGTLSRTLEFTTYYRMISGEFKRQVKTDSVLSGWQETITIGDESYTIDENMSTFTKSGVTDMTAGVDYFQTLVSYVGRYLDPEGNSIIMSVSGKNYGYNQPWSKIETQTRQIEFDFNSDQKENVVAKTESILEAKKTIYYDKTEPFPISFDGTYFQRMVREGSLSYEVLTNHTNFEPDDYSGSVTINVAVELESLPIPENLDFIEGHWAEDDVKKLYSLEIFTELPHQGMQTEAINRGDFIKALCLAMNMDLTKYKNSTEVIFGDVPVTHPLYPYVMAAYDRKLIKGTGANFDVDRPINREEAFVVYIRIIGLERLGVTESPVTPFVDDKNISSWAKKEIMAGYKLGIIEGDTKGKVNPQKWISKAEAAAIINRLVDYLRDDIGQDYRK